MDVKAVSKLSLVIISTAFVSRVTLASPWIGTTDPLLHQDLLLLVEQGYLNVAATSYPVPWKGIDGQLDSLQTEILTPEAQLAAQRLRFYLSAQQNQSFQRMAKIQLANQANRFHNFAEPQSDKNQLQFNTEFTSGRWAAKISANIGSDSNNFDQSYIAYQLGDWNLRAGAINQWWGPANGSSLILSDNARPVPSVSLSRSTAVASESAWLSWLGPWYFTAQLGETGDKREIDGVKLWRTRFNFQPVKGLEIGLSWAAMWGGEGQGNGFKDFIDIITFRPECANNAQQCDDSLDTKKGNQLAGYDIRYSFSVAGQPLSIYAQQIGEDAVDYYRVTDKATLAGISTYLWGHKIYLEHSDTNVACGNTGSTEKNCYYEHSLYQSGYRHYQRAIGSTFDSDATVTSLGINKHFADGAAYAVTLNIADLNKDQTKPSPLLLANHEKLTELSGYYQFPYLDWLIKLGAKYSQSRLQDAENKRDSLIYTEMRYHF
ncbi:capsule assembly Wzi family protein [Neptunicella marina]|uniref:Capsule assembly Wzi family protein n=1 Tax=Neptunicella marina TaxID=2125989 RepID=A0A8J6IUU6_9ALTE|nr:capsule assembly Wzi family protein [Neptunicella marina]MBC3765898.1 capsule assembly Wzi family protein [Neptunicella marina]